eukprot:752402-Hanusia_phi.AAC.3
MVRWGRNINTDGVGGNRIISLRAMSKDGEEGGGGGGGSEEERRRRGGGEEEEGERKGEEGRRKMVKGMSGEGRGGQRGALVFHFTEPVLSDPKYLGIFSFVFGRENRFSHALFDRPLVKIATDIPAEDDLEDKFINEQYKNWKVNSSAPGKGLQEKRVLIGTDTSDSEQNYLLLAKVTQKI